MYSWQLICQVPFFHVVLSFSGNVLQSVLVPSGGQVTKCHLGDSHVGSGHDGNATTTTQKFSSSLGENYASKFCMILCQSLVAFKMTQASIVDNDDGELLRVNLMNVQVGLHSFKRFQKKVILKTTTFVHPEKQCFLLKSFDMKCHGIFQVNTDSQESAETAP